MSELRDGVIGGVILIAFGLGGRLATLHQRGLRKEMGWHDGAFSRAFDRFFMVAFSAFMAAGAIVIVVASGEGPRGGGICATTCSQDRGPRFSSTGQPVPLLGAQLSNVGDLRMSEATTMNAWRKAVRLGALGAELPDHAERKRLRQVGGLTRKQVAELMRCSEQTVLLWETRTDPTRLGRDRMYRRLLHGIRQYEAAKILKLPHDDWCIS